MNATPVADVRRVISETKLSTGYFITLDGQFRAQEEAARIIALLALVPPAVLGSLLFFSGIELAVSSAPQRFSGHDLFPLLVVAALSAMASPAIGFVAGMLWVFAARRGWLRFD